MTEAAGPCCHWILSVFWSFQCIKKSCCSYFNFPCTLWNGLFFKILCDYCSFWFLFYNLSVYSLCHFSAGLFIFLLIIWESSSHVLCIEKFPSNLSLCHHLCLYFWFCILHSLKLWFLYDQISFSFFFSWLMCFFPLLNFSQFQGYLNSFDFV